MDEESYRKPANDPPADQQSGQPSERPSDQQSFDNLAEQAASGLKSDQELYLDVKQELRTHLEETADKFSREGHDAEESAELARKSFGSPLDVAAEILDANKRRMKLRALFRLAFGALIVPVAVLLALYLGYGRFARFNAISVQLVGIGANIPAAPFYAPPSYHDPTRLRSIPELDLWSSHPTSILGYWERHKSDPDGRIYYAYYALFLGADSDERAYAGAMRFGEKIEPRNALYNVLLAQRYLSRGMCSKEELYGEKRKDEVLDRRLFELGITELRKAVRKPYLRTYQAEVLNRKLRASPRATFTEEYVARRVLMATEQLPHLGRYRALSRKIPGCARLLISEGRKAEAQAVADTWIPYSKLLLGDSKFTLSHGIVTTSCAAGLAKQIVGVYTNLGEKAEAANARLVLGKLRALLKARYEASLGPGETGTPIDPEAWELRPTWEPLRSRGSFLAKSYLRGLYGTAPTKEELTPGRMHEHVVAEEVVVQMVLVIFFLLLVSAVVSGFLWVFRMRRAASAPLLLTLSANDILRILLLGVLLPMTVYWAYSRLPWIGGREFGLTSSMWLRFVIEYLLLGLTVILLPIAMARRIIRRRCGDLDLPVPTRRHEFALHLGLWGRLVVAGAVLVAVAYDPAFASLSEYDIAETSDSFTLAGMFMVFLGTGAVWAAYRIAERQKSLSGSFRLLFLLPVGLLLYCAIIFDGTIAGHTHPVFRTIGLVLALWLMLTAVVHATRYRVYGLYFGTLSRSISPICAFAIIFISLTVQPWLMYSEAQWLRADTVEMGYLANLQKERIAIGAARAREIEAYNTALRQALNGKPVTSPSPQSRPKSDPPPD